MRQITFVIVYTVFKSTFFGCNVLCDCENTTRDANCDSKNLTTVPSGIPKTISQWSMKNNQITTIEENDFQGFTVLIQLDVAFNQIKRLPANVFRGLTALKYLLLEHNQISAIDVTTFQGLTVLERLYMENNYLTVVDGQMFESLTSVFELKLDNNPLDCSNCRLKSFRDFLLNHTLLGNSPTKCDDTPIIYHNFTNCKDSKSTTNSPSLLLLVASFYLSLSPLIFSVFQLSK